MGASPGVLEGGGGEVAAVLGGDCAPEVEAVGVVEAVQAGDVDVAGAVYVLRHEAEVVWGGGVGAAEGG